MSNPNCGKCGMLNHAGFCKLTACIYPCPTGMGGYINKPITNADRIRSMTDEELAEFIASGFPKNACQNKCGGDESYKCVDCVSIWLRWEHDDGEKER